MSNKIFTSSDYMWSCNCIGPQHGQPLCPCQMKNVIIRDGRYIRKEKDLGPVSKSEYDLTDIFKNLGKKNDTN